MAGRNTEFDFLRNRQQGGSALAEEEGSSRGGSLRNARAETEREETSRFLRLQLPPPIPNTRFAGDGFDYRRPISSTDGADQLGQPPSDPETTGNIATAIDLTGSDSEDDIDSGPSNNTTATASRSLQLQIPSIHPPTTALADFLRRRGQTLQGEPSRVVRPPRFGREVLNTDVEVIDLDAEDHVTPLHQPPEENPRMHGRSSPEVQFLSSRPLSPARRRVPPIPAAPFHQHDTEINVPGGDIFPTDLDQLLEDVRIISEQAIRPQARRGQSLNRGVFTHFRQARMRRPPAPPRGAILQIDMDFRLPAFDMGMEDPEVATYNPPPDPPEGFTASPEEDDVLLCPNCDRELCTGETELDQQVWVLKGCGHVSIDCSQICYPFYAGFISDLYYSGILWNLRCQPRHLSQQAKGKRHSIQKCFVQGVQSGRL